MTKSRILVGRFGAPHGIKGEVRLKSFTSDPFAIAALKPLYDAGGNRQFAIESLRLLKDDLLIAKIAAVDDRSAAEALTHVELYVPHGALPQPASEEYYCADLIGLCACDEAGTPLGLVTDVHNFGGGDILEITPDGGGESLLLPFSKAFVPAIDLAAGRLTIVRPEEVEGEPEPHQGACSPALKGKPLRRQNKARRPRKE